MGILKQPSSEFSFKQKARTFKKRGKNNIIIFIHESNATEEKVIELETADDIVSNKDEFKDNLQAIKDCFFFDPAPALVTVYILKTEPSDISTYLDDIKNVREIAYVIYPEASDTIQKSICAWIKEQAKTNKEFKTIVVGQDADSDVMQIINLDKTEEVEFLDSKRKDKEINKYIPSLASVLAGSGATRGVTYTKLTNLKRVKQPSDINKSINEGHLVLINDDKDVRIALGINSLVTLKDDETDDLKFLEVMETLALIKRDISNIFKEKYVSQGKKNSPDMQSHFLTDINLYLSALESEDILDKAFSNYAVIDVKTQREALIESGRDEAKTWDDTKVKNTVLKRDVFIAAQLLISQGVINLNFNATVY